MRVHKKRIALMLAIGAAVFIGDLHADGRRRVIISTDIGGSDPDDFQSMVHYLIYADMFDTEGLISSPPRGGRARDILECIAAYENDYPRLRTWSSRYPSPGALRAVVRQGAIHPQSGKRPAEKLSAGAELIIERARAKDPRPLYVLVWGCITDVAQAVCAEPGIKERLRVYSIGSWNTRQDPRARESLYRDHRDLWWIENDSTFRGMYVGGARDARLGNRAFTARNVAGHGSLGALFMRKMAALKMGDTPSVLYLLHGAPGSPEAAHWGGAFSRPEPEARPTFWRDNPSASLALEGFAGAKTVSRWRGDFLPDWKQRMDRLLGENPDAGSVPGSAGIRVMSFNILNSFAALARSKRPNWPLRRRGVAEVFRKYRPDIAGTQENGLVEDRSLSSGLPAYRSVNALHTKRNMVYYRPEVVEPLESGVWWLNEAEKAGARGWGATFVRSVVWVRFRHVGTGGEFYFLDTHLSSTSQNAREKSAARILRKIRALPHGLPVILVGDLNATASNPAYLSLVAKETKPKGTGTLGDAFLITGFAEDSGKGKTGHGYQDESRKLDKRIDHVLFTPNSVTARTYAIARDKWDGIYPSDHWPVIADLTIVFRETRAKKSAREPDDGEEF